MRSLKLLLVFLLCSNQVFSQIFFEDKADELGLGENCGTTYLGNGVCFVDFDNDGWDDISLTTGFGLPIRFFKNINGTFSEQFFNIPDTNYQTKQINWVDFDNDGDKDLYVTSDYNGNRLFENDGNFNFSDITIASGLSTVNMLTYGASWGDINNDGHLDVYISNRDVSEEYPNRLYKNNGDGTFTDISESAGVSLATLSFCSAFFDYNNDGFQDIYISNDKLYTTNVLYRNNGNETFTDVSQATSTDISIDAMTVTIGDYNNDSWFDIYVTNSPEGNALLRNNGDGTFTDVADTSGTLFNSVGWGSVFLDADNDMDLDLYVSGSLNGQQANLISAAFYENLDNGTFVIPENIGFAGDTGASHSNAIGDVNNDGIPEVIVSNSNDEDLFLWSNTNAENSNNWLKVKLTGTDSNLQGVGSKIEISINGEKQYRYTHCGEGYLSQNSDVEFFGLGDNDIVDSIKVTWLSGIVDTHYNIEANQILDITEGSETLSINTIQSNLGVKIYPNPTSNFITIESESEIDFIEIYDVSGKRVFKDKSYLNQENIDVSKFKSGIYFIKLFSNNIIQVEKIVKI